MYTIIEKLGTNDEYWNDWNENFVVDLNVRFKFYTGELYITDLTNALKPGKSCTTFVISSMDYNSDQFRCEFFNWLSARQMQMGEFIQNLLADIYNTDNTGLNISKHEKKGVNTFSPLVAIKPIHVPAKWTLPHVWKAILAGQIRLGFCDGVYTDDYAYDAATNFKKGGINVVRFAKKTD